VDRGRFKPGQNCQVVAIEPEQKKRNPFRTGTLSPTARVTQIKHVVGTPPVPQAKILFVECQTETGYPAAVVAIVTEPEMLARIVLLTRPRFRVDLPPILPESQISVSLSPLDEGRVRNGNSSSVSLFIICTGPDQNGKVKPGNNNYTIYNSQNNCF